MRSRLHEKRADLSHLAPGVLSERRHLAFALAQESHAAPHAALRVTDTGFSMTTFKEAAKSTTPMACSVVSYSGDYGPGYKRRPQTTQPATAIPERLNSR